MSAWRSMAPSSRNEYAIDAGRREAVPGHSTLFLLGKLQVASLEKAICLEIGLLDFVSIYLLPGYKHWVIPVRCFLYDYTSFYE